MRVGRLALDVERMLPLVYEELRRIARRQLRHEGVGHTLNTTALVHEAYLRLAAPSHLDSAGARSFCPSRQWQCAAC